MKACRDRGVDCIVAPYEADAQLAFLNKCGIAQLVITEDSDLVLFGCDRVRTYAVHCRDNLSSPGIYYPCQTGLGAQISASFQKNPLLRGSVRVRNMS